jgi:hypothetical protein
MQKYTRGMLVWIAKNLGNSMAHFESGCFAIIHHSYSDMYGGNDADGNASYSVVFLDDGRSCSWYDENQLTLISKDRDRGEKFIQYWKEVNEKTGDMYEDYMDIILQWEDKNPNNDLP